MSAPPAKMAKVDAKAAVDKIKNMRLMTAIKTPYRTDGNIDYDAYDKHVEHQIANGVEALIVGGTTGEGHLMSWEEHLALIAHTKGRFQDKIAVVGNTGSNHTAESVTATKKGFAVGMDCSLLINPYYGKTSTKGVIMHIEAGMRYGPAIIYNVPGRTGQDIPPETIYELAKHENFCGVKECMGNDRIKLLADKGIKCWSGNDDQCHDGRHAYGAQGVISVTSNVVPALFKELMHGPRNDDLNKKLEPLYTWLFTEPNPIGVNTMMMMLGNAAPVFRMPYTVRAKADRQAVVPIIKAIGEQHFPVFGGKIEVLEDADIIYTMSGDSTDESTKQVKHIVMFGVKDGVEESAIQILKEGLLALPSKIDKIKSYEFGIDIKLPSGQSHPAGKNRTIVWSAVFDSAADYEVYATHKDHTDLIAALIKPIMEPGTRAAIQYEC